MRPLASSNFSIEGILFLTLTSRRCAQKPFSMVTACTGTFLSLACCDFARLRMPWSRQGGVAVSATEDCRGISRVPLLGAVRALRSSRPGRKQETVAEESAEEMNCLREKPGVLLMVSLLLAGLRGNLPSTNHSAAGA